MNRNVFSKRQVIVGRSLKLSLGLLLLLVGAPFFLLGEGQTESEENLNIVTTTTIVTDVVRQIAGERVVLSSLISAGQNPHAYQPTPKDIARVETADLVFVNGFNLEDNLVGILETTATGRIVEVSEGIVPREMEGHHHHDEHGDHDDHDDHDGHDEDGDHDDHDGHDEHGEHDEHDDHDEDGDHDGHDEHGEHSDHDDHDDHDAHDDHDGHDEDEHHHHGGADPHTWMSPRKVMVWVDNIVEALGEADPAHSDEYAANGEDYKNQLLQLHGEIENRVALIPRDDRILITDHHSLGYFADEYDFQIIGAVIPSFSTNAEPSAKSLAELVDTIEDYGAKALFLDAAAGENLRRLADTLNAELKKPVAIHELLMGSLNPQGEEADSYLEFMRYNLEQIITGLSGE